MFITLLDEFECDYIRDLAEGYKLAQCLSYGVFISCFGLGVNSCWVFGFSLM